jgi:excinuclease ABC subunit C
MNLEQVKKLNIPTTPGSYQYYDKTGKVIYIGKAANLRSRVLSYWRTGTDHTPAKEQMVPRITKIKWIETDTEIEALLLEANLVKKFQPYYNVLLRDDKRYAYIKISTEEEWPRVFFTREIEKSGRYFGPFTSSESVREVLKIIRHIWRFRSCATLPKKACLYYRIGQCPGMCEHAVDHKEYLKTIGEISKFLEGKRKDIEKNLKLEIRNLENELVKKSNNSTSPSTPLKTSHLTNSLRTQTHPGLPAYRTGRRTPLQGGELENKLRFLQFRLLNLKKVLENSRVLSVGDKYAADVVELAKTLSLPKVPQRIEGYDISNLFGQEAVGSMVVFKNGEPDKSQYRKFKIREIENPPPSTGLRAGRPRGASTPPRRGIYTTTPLSFNKKSGDTGMLKEVLERRFNNDWPYPDLIIIDGGKGQLNACLSILKKLQGELRSKRGCPGAKLDIPILAVSKGEGLRSAHAPDKIFFPGMKTPLVLPLASPALHIVKRVRDEAHRFAIGFHRQRRSKNWLNK